MVLLKEISEGIWGLALGPNNTSEVVTDHPVRLTMAALDIDVEDSGSPPGGITRVTIKSSTADKGPPIDLILCNLQYPSCLQQPLDIEIYDGQTLTFGVKGPHKVHLTGYVLQPEPQELNEEGHLPVGKTGDFQEAADESSDDDDDDDDDDDESDDDDDEDVFHLAHRHHLRDDEDQDLEGDYEDGYHEGEDQLTSETSTSDSDNDEQAKTSASSNKNKKRPRAEENGHPTKQEPKTKKIKKNTNTEEEQTTTGSKKTKKTTKKVAATTSNDPTTTSTTTDNKKKSNSLEIQDLRVGNGPEAKLGKNVAVYYTGRLKSNNVMFDSCVKGKPFRFRLGAGEVIRGWDQGIKGMCVGGKRRLTIPPSLAYGSQKLPDIPSNSTLVFDVELKNVL